MIYFDLFLMNLFGLSIKYTGIKIIYMYHWIRISWFILIYFRGICEVCFICSRRGTFVQEYARPVMWYIAHARLCCVSFVEFFEMSCIFTVVVWFWCKWGVFSVCSFCCNCVNMLFVILFDSAIWGAHVPCQHVFAERSYITLCLIIY